MDDGVPEASRLAAAGRRSSADRLRELVRELELPPLQKRFLESRWVDQIEWLSRRAAKARTRYYVLRLTTVVGAVAVPAVVSLTTLHGDTGRAARIATWVISLVVAMSAAVEQLFQFGDRWRTYRQTLERLKSEGWMYLQLGGAYGSDGGTHVTRYPAFAEKVESIIGSDVETYLTHVIPRDDRAPGTAPSRGLGA